ncbi:TetR/AcrR family transcriptional regulator [Rhodococcus sp. IEGM 248]|nr:TetR/AcrR family transcriptional regulator [Rhodococcus sp. IEGM 248]RZL76357.1 MAG: TetR/AcrR family transcriptional regulator [Rhodococcus sp. (in: high G+C Gram-positive bacteria)]
MGRRLKFEQAAAVDRAVDLLWGQGYSGTTPVDLVNELGLGKGSLYRSFDSKHNLFSLAPRRYSAERLESLAEGLEDDGPMRPKLKAAAARLTGVGLHERGCFRVNSIAELGHADESVTQAAAELFDGIESDFKVSVESGQATGEFGTGGSPEGIARALLVTVVGISALVKSGTDPARLSRILDTAIESL